MYRYIFEHHVKSGEEAEFLTKWKASSDIIQKQPGALGSKIFKHDDHVNHSSIYIVMADWRDRSDRSNAIKAIKAKGIKIEQHLMHVYRTIENAYELLDESMPT